MNKEKIAEEVMHIISSQIGVSTERLHLQTSFESLPMDEIDMINIVMEVEEKCLVTSDFDIEEVEKVQTIEELVDLVIKGKL